ncbi:MAG TPA: hypothetical protein VK106_03550 [Balneolaceae bacterium]|nr:hypothetical protein [Balneolaceae bacterium]
MKHIYKGILKNDHIDWNKQKPPKDKSLYITATVMEKKMDNKERGKQMAKVLEKLATSNPFNKIDASQWQHKIRKDHSMPKQKVR